MPKYAVPSVGGEDDVGIPDPVDKEAVAVDLAVFLGLIVGARVLDAVLLLDEELTEGKEVRELNDQGGGNDALPAEDQLVILQLVDLLLGEVDEIKEGLRFTALSAHDLNGISGIYIGLLQSL